MAAAPRFAALPRAVVRAEGRSCQKRQGVYGFPATRRTSRAYDVLVLPLYRHRNVEIFPITPRSGQLTRRTQSCTHRKGEVCNRRSRIFAGRDSHHPIYAFRCGAVTDQFSTTFAGSAGFSTRARPRSRGSSSPTPTPGRHSATRTSPSPPPGSTTIASSPGEQHESAAPRLRARRG
jgi:hypothetical protein